MPKYKINYEWSGYSRGTCTKTLDIPEGTEDIAAYIKANGWEADQENVITVRDDTELELEGFEIV